MGLEITFWERFSSFSRGKFTRANYDFKTFHFDKENKNWETKFNPNDYKRPIKLRFDLINAKDNKKLLKKGSKINLTIAKKLFDDGLKNILFTSEFFTSLLAKIVTISLVLVSPSHDIALKVVPTFFLITYLKYHLINLHQ